MGATTANPWVGVNFIPDNPKMAEPPAYWLQRLYDFDADLVVLPSRMVPYAYVLARRARLTAGLSGKAIIDTCTQQDTVMCMNYKLVPVSLIYRTGTSWSIDNIIASLKRRDIWAHGGAEKFAAQLDEVDAAQKKQTQRTIRDDMWARSGDAWRSYQARTGQRTRPTVGNQPRPLTGTADPSASGSTVGSGSVVVTG